MSAKAPGDLTVDDLAEMIAREDRTREGWLAAFQNRLMYRSVEIGETLEDRKALADRIRSASEIVLDRDLEGSA